MAAATSVGCDATIFSDIVTATLAASVRSRLIEIPDGNRQRLGGTDLLQNIKGKPALVVPLGKGHDFTEHGQPRAVGNDELPGHADVTPQGADLEFRVAVLDQAEKLRPGIGAGPRT